LIFKPEEVVDGKLLCTYGFINAMKCIKALVFSCYLDDFEGEFKKGKTLISLN
jgi:hypothetical protein